MTEIPESLLRRSAEAKAKALGIPVEQVLAEMRGEAPPAPPPAPAAPPPEQDVSSEPESENGSTEPESEDGNSEPEPEDGSPKAEVVTPEPEVEAEQEAPAAAVATAVMEPEAPPAPPSGNGSGNGKQAAVVSPRPVTPPTGLPEGVRTQRLLTVVKARAIQQVKAEPTDKVNTWPHLMIAELTALMAVTALLLVMSAVLQAPLLDPANPNATPNPSKAPWYFLGLQELLSYFDPQIAGVTVPTIVGMIGFMAVPFVDRNPSTRPSDRKFAVMLFTFFMAGSATLTIFGVLFRGRGFNFAYPWQDGIFFDDIKDWVFFEE
jgi:menaquinol-cytochrome c reductase cytochrome b/c subunit